MVEGRKTKTMVGKLIELENQKVVVKPICWKIKQLRDVIDFYPDNYTDYIAYFHYRTSLNPQDNPFADLEEQVKDEEIQRYLNIDVDTDNDILKEGLEVVIKLYGTTIYRSYLALKKMLDGINEDLADMQITYSKEDGNAGNVMTVIKNLSVIKKELKEAKKDYLEEQGDVRGRGDTELSYDEFDEDDDLDIDDDEDDDL